jgi:hypothetical protein
MPADYDAGNRGYSLFERGPTAYRPERLSRLRAPIRPLTRRLLFWSITILPLLLVVLLGLLLGGAPSAVGRALLHAAWAPAMVLALRAVAWTYFLPLATSGASPSPVFAVLGVYLVAGLGLLGWRRWRPALIVLLLPLLFTIPLSVIGLGGAHGQTDRAEDAFSQAAVERESKSLFDITNIDYRFVAFDYSGSKATVSCVVSLVDQTATPNPDVAGNGGRLVLKNDQAAQLEKTSSGQWQVISIEDDFHPGYEP